MTVKSSICIGVDIGATFITAVIAELTPDLRIVPWYVYELPVKGVEKGKVTNEDQLFNSIKKAIKYIETVVQESSHNILVTMPSKEFEFVTNLGVYRITNENGVITKNDKLECIKRAKSFSKKQGYTSLHAISLSYKVNGELVEDPVNVSGKVIEVNTYNVLADTFTLNVVANCFRRLGKPVNGFVYDLLASAETCLTSDEKKNGAFVLDIGGYSTKIGFFKEGQLQYSFISPFAGVSITNDIAFCFKLSYQEAESVKLKCVDLMCDLFGKPHSIDFQSLEGKKCSIPIGILQKVIISRLDEIINLILKGVSHSIIDYSVVVIGGSSQFLGLIEYLNGKYHSSFRLGVNDSLQASNLSSKGLTALGLLEYGLKSGVLDIPLKKKKTIFSLIKRIFS